MIKLYSNIKELRKQNSWSQEELAKRMGYTDRSMIAKIESGVVDLAESKIMAFAKVFDVSPWALMGLDVPMEPAAPVEQCADIVLTELESEIIARFRKADEFDQETVLRTLRIKRDGSWCSMGTENVG